MTKQANIAIMQRFAAEWGDETPIQYPNTHFIEPADTAWVRVSVKYSGARRASMGAPEDRRRHLGVVYVSVFAPLGVGDARALDLGDKAATIFRDWDDAATGLEFLEEPLVRDVGAGDKWYQVNVLCPFKRDTVK